MVVIASVPREICFYNNMIISKRLVSCKILKHEAHCHIFNKISHVNEGSDINDIHIFHQILHLVFTQYIHNYKNYYSKGFPIFQP